MQNLLADNKKVFLLFLVIALLFFGNSIGNSYSFDDSYVTVTNFKEAGKKYIPNNEPVAKGFAGIPKIWRSRYGHGNGTAYDYRPVVATTFAIEYGLFGQSPRASHFINVILYALVLFLLFLVLRRILEIYPFRESFAFVCCLLFAAHPIHTEVVASLKSRDELLGLLFGLLSIWHVLKFERELKKVALLWAGVFLFLALYSKLTSAVFIGIIPLTLWLFTKTSKRHLLFFVIGALIVYIIQSQVRKALVTEKEFRILYHFENPMATEHFSFLTRVLFALKTLGVYIRLMIFPWPLRYYYGASVITSNVGLGDMDVWIAVLSLGAAIAFCYRTKNKLAIYGLLFFCISIAPVLNFVRPVAGIVGERLLFIPSVGFLFFITAVLFYFFKGFPANFTPSLMLKKPLALVTYMLPIFLVYDWSRNADWKNEITLFEHDSKYLEHSAGANNLLANKYAEFLYAGNRQYSQQFLIDKSLEHYALALKADSSVYSALNNAGSVMFAYRNEPALALKYFLSAVRLHPDYPQAYENIGDCYSRLGKRNEAAAAYKKAISQNPKQFRSYLELASIQMDAKEFEQALAVLASAEVAFPQSYPFMERIGVCYYQKGEKQKGLSLLEQAYALYPNKKLAQTLFEYLANEGQIEKANTYKAAAQQ